MRKKTRIFLTLGLLIIPGTITGCSEPIAEEPSAIEDNSEEEARGVAVEEAKVTLEETDSALKEETVNAAKDAIRSVIETDFTR